MPIKTPLLGIEEMRKAVRLFNCLNETFNQKYSSEELLKIARACWASEYDILPDEWTSRQVKQALEGKVPAWEDNDGDLVPLYPHH